MNWVGGGGVRTERETNRFLKCASVCTNCMTEKTAEISEEFGN